MNSVATTSATQPVCNAERAAHAFRSDQLVKYKVYPFIIGRLCVYFTQHNISVTKLSQTQPVQLQLVENEDILTEQM